MRIYARSRHFKPDIKWIICCCICVFYRQHKGCRWIVSGHWRTWCWGISNPTKAWSLLCCILYPVIRTVVTRAQVGCHDKSVFSVPFINLHVVHIIKHVALIAMSRSFTLCCNVQMLCFAYAQMMRSQLLLQCLSVQYLSYAPQQKQPLVPCFSISCKS